MDAEVAGRIAENEARFRAANERIEQAAERAGVHELVPFICECSRRGCRELLRLSLVEYEGARRSPRRFVVTPDHVEEEVGVARVVFSTDRYVFVEKEGAAAAVAAQLDQRERGL